LDSSPNAIKAVTQTEHLQAIFGDDEGDDQSKDVFALPTNQPTEFIIFKLVSVRPERRSYLQRAFALSQDDGVPSW